MEALTYSLTTEKKSGSLIWLDGWSKIFLSNHRKEEQGSSMRTLRQEVFGQGARSREKYSLEDLGALPVQVRNCVRHWGVNDYSFCLLSL